MEHKSHLFQNKTERKYHINIVLPACYMSFQLKLFYLLLFPAKLRKVIRNHVKHSHSIIINVNTDRNLMSLKVFMLLLQVFTAVLLQNIPTLFFFMLSWLVLGSKYWTGHAYLQTFKHILIIQNFPLDLIFFSCSHAKQYLLLSRLLMKLTNVMFGAEMYNYKTRHRSSRSNYKIVAILEQSSPPEIFWRVHRQGIAHCPP